MVKTKLTHRKYKKFRSAFRSLKGGLVWDEQIHVVNREGKWDAYEGHGELHGLLPLISRRALTELGGEGGMRFA